MFLIYSAIFLLAWIVTQRLWTKFNEQKPKASDVVLITGGCMGIGRQVALQYAASKCIIVIWDVAYDIFPQVAKEIQKAGGNPILIRCDIRIKEEVAKALKETFNQVDQIDILINNAGIVCGKPFFDQMDEDIKRTFDVNVFGSLWVLREVYATGKLKHVTQICSVMSYLASTGVTEYTASKYAINGFMRSIRLELKQNKIPLTTTCIYPWVINTGMFAGVTPAFMVKLLLPNLDEAYVGKVVYNATCQRKEEVVIPKIFNIAFVLIHILPTWITDNIYLYLSGSAMENFIGRHAKTE